MLLNAFYFSKKDSTCLQATEFSFSAIDDTRYLNFKRPSSPNGIGITYTTEVDNVIKHFLKFSDLVSNNLLKIPVNTCVLVEEQFIPPGLPPIKHNVADNAKIAVVIKCLEVLRTNVAISLVKLGFKAIVTYSTDLVAHTYVNGLSSISSNIEITFKTVDGMICISDFNTVIEGLNNTLKSREYLNIVATAYQKETN